LEPIVGMAFSTPISTPRRAYQPTIADRTSGEPCVAGYPGASTAAARASRMRAGTGSTGDPIARSTTPSGCDPAASRNGTSEFHGKSGRASGTGSVALRRKRRDDGVITRDDTDLRGTARGADFGEELDVGRVVVAPLVGQVVF